MKKAITLMSMIFLQIAVFAQEGYQSFTASGTFIVPAEVTFITIQVLGAGGSGGGNGTGGGGGGGYAVGEFTVTPGEALDIVIGEGGGGASTGTSAVVSLIKATGGENGTSVPNPNLGGGGAGGVGLGGSIANYTGGTGGGGYYTYFGGGGGGAAGPNGDGAVGGNTIVWDGTNCLTPGGAGGIGGGVPAGDGGKGAGFTDDFCTISDPAANGVKYGGGGGGGNGNGGAPGMGAGGYIEISWGFGTGIHHVVNSKVLVSPTLFSDKINLQNTQGNENYELQNVTGQSIWIGKAIEQEDFSNLTAGNYFLRVQSESGWQTIRLVKQ